MLCCRIVNGIKNKNIKNSLGAMHCPKDKNHSPFHGEQQPAIYTENQQVEVFFNKVHNIVDHNLVNPTNTA